MARRGRRVDRPLPPPLPPAERTVGQLVGEAIRIYGSDFWRSLLLGVPIVLVNSLAWVSASGARGILFAPLAAALVSLSYVGAIALVHSVRVRARETAAAYALAVVLFIPFPPLATLFVLPGIAWLALVGLSVPALMIERVGFRAAVARGIALARVDFVHVLGGLSTLALVVIVSQFSLYFVLREFAENTRLAAAALASLVVSPVVFLGAAILYSDQDARLRSRDRRRKE